MYLIYQSIDIAINGAKGAFQFSTLFLLLIVTVPLQSIAEEYFFVEFLCKQGFSWLNIPILAVIIQAIIFALFNGYNSFGFLETLTMGLICGFITWKTNGLDVSCAIHTANNFQLVYSSYWDFKHQFHPHNNNCLSNNCF